MEGKRVRYPIGIQSFKEIREGGYVYVDKTGIAYHLTQDYKYVFLARPRRFGKSLLLSTLKAYFEGKMELFKGLEIEKLEKDWKKHPVLLLSFARLDSGSPNSLASILEQQFQVWEEELGIRNINLEFGPRFSNIILQAYKRTGEKVVVLVDEYDNPLISTLENPQIHEANKNLLKSVYTNLKDLDEYIKFGMLTGVSRFSKLSVFSGLNNLTDISLDPAYSAICGITPEELLDNFQVGIHQFAQKEGLTFDETVALLKQQYDGYHFTENLNIDIYNPYSLLNCLSKNKLGSFWYTTGTPTFLLESLRKHRVNLQDYLNEKVGALQLSSIDTYQTSPLALLFQTGYLTIKGYQRLQFRDRYTLGIPNREVREGLMYGLSKEYQKRDIHATFKFVEKILENLDNGKAEDFIHDLKSYFGGIPHNVTQNVSELFFENNTFILLNLLGVYCNAEYTTANGRIDLLIQNERFVYVIEMKLDGSANEALKQINEKDYSLPFQFADKIVFKIGINFSSKERNIDSWIIEK